MALNRTLVFDGQLFVSENKSRRNLSSIRDGIALDSASLMTFEQSGLSISKTFTVTKFLWVNSSAVGATLTIGSNAALTLGHTLFMTGSIGSVTVAYNSGSVNSDLYIVYA